MYTQIESSRNDSSLQLASVLVQKKNHVNQRAELEDNRHKGIVQKRAKDVIQSRQPLHIPKLVNRGVLQSKGINYEAGQGSMWHVHKDHVKYNGDDRSRINFDGRTKTYIKKEMEMYHNTLSHNKNRHHTYLECRKWINKHL